MYGPETIHGEPVLKAHPFPKRPLSRGGRVVLVRLRDKDEYVAACHFYDPGPDGQPVWDHEWWQGDYCFTALSGLAAFEDRCSRWC